MLPARFRAYGSDPYRLARAAIRAGVNYVDLSDAAEFSLGIVALDAEAKAAGCYALSGVSSVPALSAAAVHVLSRDMPRIHAIDAAILPGNRAPRGRSVMAAILTQVGRPLRLWRGGIWESARGWSDPRTYVLQNGERRRAYLNRVPDLECFPAHFGARTVTFRAGLELSVMSRGLAALSWLRKYMPVPVPVGLAQIGAQLLEPFGSDRGGMVVSVTGDVGDDVVTRHWRLLAQGGDGPFVPAAAARALVAQGGAAPGARIALDDIPLPRIEQALADLDIDTAIEEEPTTCLFAEVLGTDFEDLPDAVQDSHAVFPVLRLSGEARVTRGPGWWPNLLARIFGFPAAGEAIPVTVKKTRSGDCELWQRQFGAQSFRSTLRATARGMTERFGPFTFRLGLVVSDKALHFPVVAGRLGPIPLPRFALPKSETREYAEADHMRFDVTLRAPLTGAFIIRYEGALQPLA